MRELIILTAVCVGPWLLIGVWYRVKEYVYTFIRKHFQGNPFNE